MIGEIIDITPIMMGKMIDIMVNIMVIAFIAFICIFIYSFYRMRNRKTKKIDRGMAKKSKQQPDWIASILLIFGAVAILNGNNVGFLFLIFALIKCLWSLFSPKLCW